MTTLGAAGRGLLFFGRFLRNPRTVGAICPSTRALGEAMLDALDLHAGDVVVEYGPGTGSLTAAIHDRHRAVGGLRYLGIERERSFCDVLARRWPDFTFACAQVEDVARLLRERDLPPPQAIVSGLPLIFLPTMPAIVATAAAVLAPGGSFRTFTYLQSAITPAAARVRRELRRHFDTVSRSPLVWGNFPPAYVLRGDRAADRPARPGGENAGERSRTPPARARAGERAGETDAAPTSPPASSDRVS